MRLRRLCLEDAPLMIEWMHDESVVRDLQTDFMCKTITDCEIFIKTSQIDSNNVHLAVVNDENTYMGTVSLKNIGDGSAEFAIAVRKDAMGKGYSKYAIKEMIRIGIDDMALSCIYWCVSPENKRAVRFYDKNGYKRVKLDEIAIRGRYSEAQMHSYIWYAEIAGEKKEGIT